MPVLVMVILGMICFTDFVMAFFYVYIFNTKARIFLLLDLFDFFFQI